MTSLAHRLWAQVWGSRRVLAAAVIPAAALMIVVAIVSLSLDIPLGHIVSDPLSEVGADPLLGFVSNLGILMWAGAAAASLVAWLAHRTASDPARLELRRFFAWSVALSTVLALDDTFQVHERLIPRLLGHGQTTLMLVYVLLVAVYVWRFRRVLAASRWVVLAASGAFFAASIFVDVFPYAARLLPIDLGIDPETFGTSFVVLFAEESPKFLGIALWLAYHVQAAAGVLVPRSASAGSGDA